MKKVVFDTNFWSYLAASGRSKEFEDLERKLKIKILLPPSILLEVLETKDPEKRVLILQVMRKHYRAKLRTEADLEVEEVINEVRRLLPSIRRPISKTKRIKKLRKFWCKEIWKSCIENHEELHNRLRKSDHFDKNKHLERQKKAKKDCAWDINKTIPSNISAKFSKIDQRFSKFVDYEKKYEPWRINCFELYWTQLSFVDLPINNDPKTLDQRTTVDWCEPWIKIKAFLENKERYCTFWLEEVDVANMPRNYVRWAMDFLQPLRKLGTGNARDSQHTAYLIGPDAFFTCDRRYFDCLSVIYRDGVVKIAQPKLLSADPDSFLNEIEHFIMTDGES